MGSKVEGGLFGVTCYVRSYVRSTFPLLQSYDNERFYQ